MTKRVAETITLSLEYTGGRDEPKRGVFRNFPTEPPFTEELVVAIRSDSNPVAVWAGDRTDRPQVHLAGTARALEASGVYLVALARLKTQDP